MTKTMTMMLAAFLFGCGEEIQIPDPTPDAGCACDRCPAIFDTDEQNPSPIHQPVTCSDAGTIDGMEIHDDNEVSPVRPPHGGHGLEAD